MKGITMRIVPFAQDSVGGLADKAIYNSPISFTKVLQMENPENCTQEKVCGYLICSGSKA
jgi:hypothetical protein